MGKIHIITARSAKAGGSERGFTWAKGDCDLLGKFAPYLFPTPSAAIVAAVLKASELLTNDRAPDKLERTRNIFVAGTKRADNQARRDPIVPI